MVQDGALQRGRSRGAASVPRGQVDRRVHRDGAVLDDHDPVGEHHGLGHVVGDQHGGEPVLASGLLEDVLHLEAGQGVEGAQGFVEQQQAGAADERARQRDAALLAARQPRRPLARAGAQADAFQGRPGALRPGLVAPLLAAGRLRQVRADAVGLRAGPDGVTVECRDADDFPLPPIGADRAVVATGNEAPSLPPEPWRHVGWGDPGPCRVAPDAPVVVVGTGLTMVDRALWLLHAGHRGPITAVSRHGLIPQPHRVGASPEDLAEGHVPFGTTLAALTAWLRARAARTEREGGDWRSCVDALRPHTQALWGSLSHGERRRFLRHVWPFWNVHRHRIAPPAAETLAEAGRRGQFRVLAGRVTGFAPRPGGVTVSVERRHEGDVEDLEAAAVFECRGRAGDVRRTDNPLLRALLDDGAARPDPLGLGLAVAEDCGLLDAAGRPSDRLFAMGPVTAGTFWEITAVPDIRAQAARLATALTATPEDDAASAPVA